MSQSSLSIRMDENLKREFSALCDSIGMTMSTAFCIFVKKSVAEQRIPFDVTTNDPFYSASNIAHLEKIISDVKSGKAHFAEHELIEADDE